jgi:hypothetical protein
MLDCCDIQHESLAWAVHHCAIVIYNSAILDRLKLKAMESALTAAHYEVALMAPTNTKVGVRLES